MRPLRGHRWLFGVGPVWQFVVDPVRMGSEVNKGVLTGRNHSNSGRLSSDINRPLGSDHGPMATGGSRPDAVLQAVPANVTTTRSKAAIASGRSREIRCYVNQLLRLG